MAKVFWGNILMLKAAITAESKPPLNPNTMPWAFASVTLFSIQTHNFCTNASIN